MSSLRSFRRKRRPGNRKPTKAEAARIVESKTLCCVPCYVWAIKLQRMPIEDIAVLSAYDHKKSGNIRRGHRYGFASCDWHHQGYPGDGWTGEEMTAHFGPSLANGSRIFHDTYGTDDELIELQDELLRGERAA